MRCPLPMGGVDPALSVFLCGWRVGVELARMWFTLRLFDLLGLNPDNVYPFGSGSPLPSGRTFCEVAEEEGFYFP